MQTPVSQVIKDALAEVERAKAVRERNMARSAEMQRKVATLINRPSVYVLRRYGGQQMTLDLVNKSSTGDRDNVGNTTH